MVSAPTPNQSSIITVLGQFLVSILPAGVPVVQAQINKVPEVSADDFVTMTPLARRRLSTNVDTYTDTSFTASIAGALMTVSAIEFGAIAVGQPVFGEGVTSGTAIAALGSGAGGVGTYTLSQAQTVSSEAMASGTKAILQPTEVTIQLDVHGPNSADNAQTISTLFRDAYATTFFAGSGVSPFYADDPAQMPYSNDQTQVEERWTLDAVMQANQVIAGLPTQFADEIEITASSVQADFPPSS